MPDRKRQSSQRLMLSTYIRKSMSMIISDNHFCSLHIGIGPVADLERDEGQRSTRTARPRTKKRGAQSPRDQMFSFCVEHWNRIGGLLAGEYFEFYT